MRISWRMMLLLVLTGCAHAGGPEFVAGVSYFDPIAKGNPLTWPQPFISYFTPAEMVELAREAGFAHAEHISADALTARYFANRSDGLAPPKNGEELVVART